MNCIKVVLEEKGSGQTCLHEKLGKCYSLINDYPQDKNQLRLETLFEITKIQSIDLKYLLIPEPQNK